MATEQHSCILRAATNRQSTTRNRRATAARRRCTPPDPLRPRLRELVRNLRLAKCALLIAAQVVQAQNADHDADVAQVLRHDIGLRLDAEIDATEAMLASLAKGEGNGTSRREAHVG